jgi:hypothetical protein
MNMSLHSQVVRKSSLILTFSVVIVLSLLIITPYQITASSSLEAGDKQPLPTPQSASKGGHKVFVAIMRSVYPDQSALVNLYRQYLTSTDYVMCFPNTKNLNYALQLPGIKGVSYFSLAEIQANAPLLKSQGIDFIAYDIERSYSPPNDVDNITASISAAQNIVHSQGMAFMSTPSGNVIRPHVEAFAQYSDIVNPQGQTLQQNASTYAQYIINTSSQLRAVNPSIKIIAELSTVKGDVQNMKQAFMSVAPYVDGATIWYRNTPVDLEQIKQFLSWFRSNY